MTTSNSNCPKFIHSQVENLYKYGIGIPEEILSEILHLPRQELIYDLELVLSDAVARYGYFHELEWKEETNHFPLHAIFLLMELRATESLDKIFHFLGGDDDFLEYWISDHRTMTLWQCFYKLGFNNTVPLKEFLMEHTVNKYCKTAVSVALTQIALHNPEKKDEIEDLYNEVLNYFVQQIDPNIIDDIDSDYIALLICDIIDCRFSSLLPVIKELYMKSYVSLGVVGSYESVEVSISDTYSYDERSPIFNIFELYKDVLDTWYGYNPSKHNNYRDSNESPDCELPNTPFRSSPKIGRNDSCPCGSGKKYKKCCMYE